jgi:hypothetical protein
MQSGKPFIFDRANLAFASGQSRQLGSWKDIGLFAVAIPVMAGFLLYGIVLQTWLFQLEIDSDYGVTEAEVTDGYSVRRMLLFVSYNLDYTYHVNDLAYDGSQWVGDLWNRVQVGDSLNVRYSTGDPSRAYIEGETLLSPGRATWTLLTIVISSFMLIVAIVVVYIALSQRRLLKNGKRIIGTLISVRETKLGKGGIVSYSAVFEFLAPDGTRIEGKKSVTDSVTGDYRPPPNAGTSVLILYQDEKHYLLL